MTSKQWLKGLSYFNESHIPFWIKLVKTH